MKARVKGQKHCIAFFIAIIDLTNWFCSNVAGKSIVDDTLQYLCSFRTVSYEGLAPGSITVFMCLINYISNKATMFKFCTQVHS